MTSFARKYHIQWNLSAKLPAVLLPEPNQDAIQNYRKQVVFQQIVTKQG